MILDAIYTQPPAIYLPLDFYKNSGGVSGWHVSGLSSFVSDALNYITPKDQYAVEQAEKNKKLLELKNEVDARINNLITYAQWDGEPLSALSLSDLRTFLSEITFVRRPSVYLLDNGNFRLVWTNSEKEQAAFQFRGEGIVHCVFFEKRQSPRLPLSRETLVDTLPIARARLANFARLV